MAIASVRVPISALPSAAGSTSWLGSLGDAVDSSLVQAGQDKSFDRLANQIGGAPVEQQQPGFLARLFGAQAPAAPPVAAIPAPAAQSQMAASSPAIAPSQGSVTPGQSNDVYKRFIGTVQQAGVTNPNALAAIAATGRAESSYDPSKVNAAWPDPSASGQAGTAGGIMSWRNERLANLRNFAQSQGEDPSNISPETQAKFFVQEDPTLVAKLNAAKSPQEAASLMAKAWAFKGYDQPGGEAARRQALTQNYYATEFANQQPVQVASAGSAVPMEQGDGPGPAAPPAAPFNPATASPTAMMQQLGLGGPAAGQAPYVDPQVTTAAQQPQGAQVAAAAPSAPAVAASQPVAPTGPQTLAAGVAPIPKGGVSIPLIQSMLRDPNLRQAGLQLWQQNATGKTSDGWDFVKLDDGTLARANKQTGEVQALGNFGSAKKTYLSDGQGNFLNTDTGQFIEGPGKSKAGGGEYGLNPIYGTDANGKTGIGQVGKDGSFHLVDTGGFQPVGNVSNTNLGTTVQTRDKAGNIISTSAIDNAGKIADETTGKNLATNQQALPGVLAASDQLISTIDSLARDPHLDSMLGPISSRLPTITSDGARVKSKMDQITGQTFLQAYNTLRGGGAITDIEGQKATESLNRLNTAQNPQDYREALNDFRSIVVQAASRARAQAGQATGGDGASPTAAAPTTAAKPTGKTSSGVSWSVEP